MALGKGIQSLLTCDSEGKEPGNSTPTTLLRLLFDLLPGPRSGCTTLEPEGREAHMKILWCLPGHTEHVEKVEGVQEGREKTLSTVISLS